MTATTTRTFSRGFWAAILALALGTIALVAIAGFTGQTRRELPKAALEALLSEAAQDAIDRVRDTALEPALAAIFAPVRAAIPAYADFHYSVLGEYIELTEAALGQASKAMQERMFAGFEERARTEVDGLDSRLETAYAEALRLRLEDLRASSGVAELNLGQATRTAINDARRRFAFTAPVGTIAATAVVSGAAKTAATALATKLGTKLALKSAAKATGKLGSALAGGAGGALACSWSGPGAVLCGALAGTVTWFAVDAAIVTIDEWFNRAEFEQELAAMVDDLQAEMRDHLLAALETKSADLDAGTQSLRDRAR